MLEKVFIETITIEDHIEIGILCPQDLQHAIRSHESYFMNEVLGVKLELEDIESLAYNQSVKIDGIDSVRLIKS